MGAIGVGMEADLVLLEGDPLADIGNVKRIAAVVLDGRLFPDGELAGLMDEAARLAAAGGPW